ncbi:MAG: hypothetical protein ACKO8G_05895, partial [Actinomycetota bacterium]
LFNDLEAPVVARHPTIGAGHESLVAASTPATIMSGSGSSVVGLCRDPDHAAEVAASVEGAVAVTSGAAVEAG